MSPKRFGHQGGRRVGLPTWGRQSKRCLHGHWKNRRWYRCWSLTKEDFGSLFPVSAAEWYDHVWGQTGSRRASLDSPQGRMEVPCTYFDVYYNDNRNIKSVILIGWNCILLIIIMVTLQTHEEHIGKLHHYHHLYTIAAMWVNCTFSCTSTYLGRGQGWALRPPLGAGVHAERRRA